MEKKVMSKEVLLANRDEILTRYEGIRPKGKKLPLLTKKEKKTLGIGKDLGTATARHVRIAPRKALIVSRLIKGKGLDEAYAILLYTPKAASPIISKIVKSAESNAVNNNELARENLYVSDCFVNQGPVMKRIIPRARGGAARINKRTSHITVVLKQRD